jgi:hypothetical protein
MLFDIGCSNRRRAFGKLISGTTGNRSSPLFLKTGEKLALDICNLKGYSYSR